MKFALEDLKLIVLECPYHTWHEEQTQRLFSKMAQLRFVSYQDEYGYGVLPVDKIDWISTHFILCHERGGELEPVWVMKNVTTRRCHEFSVEFPALAMLDSPAQELHRRFVEETCSRALASGQALGYTGSRAVDPAYRDDREFCLAMRDICITIHTQHQIDSGLAGDFCLAIARLSTRMLETLGYQKIRATADRELGTVILPTYFNAEAFLMWHGETFPETTLAMARRHLALWQNRIIVGSGARSAPLRKAA